VGFAPLTKLFFFSALSLLLMFGDKQLQFTKPIRAGLSTLVLPVQWLVLQPGQALDSVSKHFQSLEQAQENLKATELKILQMSVRSQQVEQLQIENQTLRQLMGMSSNISVPFQAAEILFDVPDPYNQRLVLNKGQVDGVALGSPVIDAGGVIGQITRLLPLTSEVTLLTDHQQSIPVLNSRTGARNITNGDMLEGVPMIELKFVPASADVKEGDLLTTSGIDGVYPAGLQVARISHIERRVDISFARIHAKPLAELQGRHVLILQPTGTTAAATAGKGKAP
jgi:rod shape-determining protein MreC